MTENVSTHTKRLVVTAMFISLGLVLRIFFTHDIPMFGERGMRIGISGIFTAMPSILFGPVYGAITGVLTDILGFILRPTGPYLWQITVVMAMGGFLRGWLWFALRRRSTIIMRAVIAVFCVAVMAAGIYNTWAVERDNLATFFDPYVVEMKIVPEITEPDGIHWRDKEPGLGARSVLRVKNPADVHAAIEAAQLTGVSRFLVERVITVNNPGSAVLTHVVTLTTALVGTSIMGIVLLGADLLVSWLYGLREKKRQLKASATRAGGTRTAPASPVLFDASSSSSSEPESRPRMPITALVIAMVVSGLIVTTLNTVILRETIMPGWQLIPFYLVWLPRAVQEVVANIVLAYFVTVLYGLFERQPFLRKLLP